MLFAISCSEVVASHLFIFIICCSEVLEAVDVLKHRKEELLNWLPPSPLLNFYLRLLTNQLISQFNGQSLTSLVN